MDLSSYTFPVVSFLPTLVVLGQIVLAVIIGAALLEKGGVNGARKMLGWFGRNGLLLMLIVSLTAMLGSLFFSEIAGWNPCKYCWIQRIFLYPQVVLLLVALWKKDRSVARYILALSIIGALYAAYHYYIQLYDIVASPTNPATPCDASGESCVKTPFMWFGYITIPMMALTAFVLNIAGSLLTLRSQRKL
jgi:disulfide bond formation protein DsbB